MKYAINGLLSLTPDGLPLLGETPEVKGLWSCAAVWVKEGPGIGAAVAEWMTHGESEIDLHSSDIARLLGSPEDPRPRQGARGRGLQQDLRHRPPGRAVGVESRRSPASVPRARARARRRLLRGGRLGAAAVVRVERAAPRGVRRPGDAARGRVGLALVVADHQRRAPGDARPGRHGRPERLRDLRHRRARRAGRRAGRVGAADGRRRRAGRLHADPLARRRLQGRPHDHAARRGALPRRHRRRPRRGRQEVVHGPPPGRRERPALRRHDRLDDARPVGPAGPRHPRVGHVRRRVARGLPVRVVPRHRDRLAARARVADLVRRRPGLGALRPDGAGREAVGHPVGGRPRARRGARRHRRLRHHRPPREVLPGLRVRARDRVQRGRGGHVGAEGEGRRLRRPRRPSAPPRGGARRRPSARSPSTTTRPRAA